ncbi:MAG: response regulator [Verrucomicrobiota bacterium]|jgi:CheY-like chemotaxis protein
MSEDHPLNKGEKHNSFPLVSRPSSAVEKAAPGAKRIISGMVAETLALAKRQSLRIVITDDEPMFLELYELIIRDFCKEVTFLKFGNAEKALQELSREEPDLLIADVNNGGKLSVHEMLRLLADRKAKFPILVISGTASEEDVRQCAGSELNVSFMSKPFQPKALWTVLETALKTRRDADTPAIGEKKDQVKKVFSVLVGGGIIDNHAELYGLWLQSQLADQYDLRVAARDNAVELIRLAEQQPFDLFMVILNNVWQDLDKIELEPSDGGSWGDRIMLLQRLKSQFGKPIIALSGRWEEMESRTKRAGADAFLPLPSSIDAMRSALIACRIDLKN